MCGVSHCTLSSESARAVAAETGCCTGCFLVMSLGEYCKTQTTCLTGSARCENLDLESFEQFTLMVKPLHHHLVK